MLKTALRTAPEEFANKIFLPATLYKGAEHIGVIRHDSGTKYRYFHTPLCK